MNIIPYQIIRTGSLTIAVISIIVVAYLIHKMRKKSERWTRIHLIEGEALFLVITLGIGICAGVAYSGFASVPLFTKTFGPGAGPQLPLQSSFEFFMHLNKFDKIDSIAADPNAVSTPIFRNFSKDVSVTITAKEVISEIAPGITFNYWTFDNQVPGPFIRARLGDKVIIKLVNDKNNLHEHSIDFHAVNGPGGGANILSAKPGEEKIFSFKALHPGLFVYHCASPPSAAAHMTHGQYGLILIEPAEGLSAVDKEFYVMQGEIYTLGNAGDLGLQAFDAQAMLDGNPNYVVFNGKINGLADKMNVKKGDSVRIFFGNGGVNLISSFHVIGELFDTVYPEASIGGAMFHNVQTTIVPAGGATIVEFKVDEPGKYVLVDHALAKVEKGAFGILTASGDFDEEIYFPAPPSKPSNDNMH